MFLVGEDHFEYTDLIMKNSIGVDWQDFFDIVMLNCKKPLF
jgi:hypothetical protein